MCGLVVGVEQLAVPEGQAAAADAPVETVPEALEDPDLMVDAGSPRSGQARPVLVVRCAVLGQRRKGGTDLVKRQADLLGHANERHASKRVSCEPALAGGGARRADESFGLVETKGGCGQPSPFAESSYGHLWLHSDNLSWINLEFR